MNLKRHEDNAELGDAFVAQPPVEWPFMLVGRTTLMTILVLRLSPSGGLYFVANALCSAR